MPAFFLISFSGYFTPQLLWHIIYELLLKALVWEQEITVTIIRKIKH